MILGITTTTPPHSCRDFLVLVENATGPSLGESKKGFALFCGPLILRSSGKDRRRYKVITPSPKRARFRGSRFPKLQVILYSLGICFEVTPYFYAYVKPLETLGSVFWFIFLLFSSHFDSTLQRCSYSNLMTFSSKILKKIP